MTRSTRAIVLLIALGLYVPAAYGVVTLFAMISWLSGGMCDFDCGANPDRPTYIAIWTAVAFFFVAAILGLIWVRRGGSGERTDRGIR